MTSDMAAVKAELSALKTRVADQDRQLQELKKELDDKTSGAPTHTEVQEKRPASSPDWTPEQKKSRSEEGLDKILEPFWPERPDARERLSERQQAFFLYMMDQLKVKGECFKSLHCLTRKRSLTQKSRDTNNSNVLIFLSDRRNLELNAATVQSEGVSRGVWDEDWSPERIQTSFTKYLEKKSPAMLQKCRGNTSRRKNLTGSEKWLIDNWACSVALILYFLFYKTFKNFLFCFC